MSDLDTAKSNASENLALARVSDTRRASDAVSSPDAAMDVQSDEAQQLESEEIARASHEQSQEAKRKALCRFLELLPREIRDQIYIYCLCNPDLGTSKFLTNASAITPYRTSHNYKFASFDLCPALLRTNRQIYHEASIVLYTKNTFILNLAISGAYKSPFQRYNSSIYPGQGTNLFFANPVCKRVRNWTIVLQANSTTEIRRPWKRVTAFCRMLSGGDVKTLIVLILPRQRSLWRFTSAFDSPTIAIERTTHDPIVDIKELDSSPKSDEEGGPGCEVDDEGSRSDHEISTMPRHPTAQVLGQQPSHFRNLHVVLKPFCLLRNLTSINFRAIDAQLWRTYNGDIKSLPSNGVDIPPDLENEIKALSQGETRVRNIYGMYTHLLLYVQIFERDLRFRKDLSLPIRINNKMYNSNQTESPVKSKDKFDDIHYRGTRRNVCMRKMGTNLVLNYRENVDQLTTCFKECFRDMEGQFLEIREMRKKLYEADDVVYGTRIDLELWRKDEVFDWDTSGVRDGIALGEVQIYEKSKDLGMMGGELKERAQGAGIVEEVSEAGKTRSATENMKVSEGRGEGKKRSLFENAEDMDEDLMRVRGLKKHKGLDSK